MGWTFIWHIISQARKLKPFGAEENSEIYWLGAFFKFSTKFSKMLSIDYEKWRICASPAPHLKPSSCPSSIDCQTRWWNQGFIYILHRQGSGVTGVAFLACSKIEILKRLLHNESPYSEDSCNRRIQNIFADFMWCFIVFYRKGVKELVLAPRTKSPSVMHPR